MAGAALPTALYPIAKNLGAEVRHQSLGPLGRLDVEHGRFVIRLRGGHGFRQQRFTLAHELGHLAALRSIAVDGGDVRAVHAPELWSALEDACDAFAAQLLMPGRDIQHQQIERLTTEWLYTLYDRFLVSWEALLRRLTEQLGPCSASLWRLTDRCWRLGRQIGGRRFHELPHDLRPEMVSCSLIDDAWVYGCADGVFTYMHDGEDRDLLAVAVALRRPTGCGQLPLVRGKLVGDDELPAPTVVVMLVDPCLTIAPDRGCATEFDPLDEFSARFLAA